MNPADHPDWQFFKKEAIDLFAQNRPELWRKCYPRIYEEAAHGQYDSVKSAAITMMGAAAKVEQGFAGANEIIEIAWASRLAQYRVPTYWITRDMAEAIKKTTPPQQINLEEIKLPFEAALFMIPRGTLVHDDPKEGDATFVSYSRIRTKEIFPALIGKTFTPEDSAMGFFAHTRAEHLLHWNLPNREKFDLAALDNLVQMYDGVEDHDSEFPSLFEDLSMNHADNVFMGRVCHFILGTVILMTIRPDLVTVGALQKRIHKANQEPKEFWSPNIIGEHYRIRKVYIPQGGTHASPRGHFVRGFYRDQPYGPLHSLRKEMWIEPFWRGGEVS